MSKKLLYEYIDFSSFQGSGDAIWLAQDGTTHIQRAQSDKSTVYRFKLKSEDLEKVHNILLSFKRSDLRTHDSKAIPGQVIIKFGFRDSTEKWNSFHVVEDDWKNQPEEIRRLQEIARRLLKLTTSEKPASVSTFKPGQLKLESPADFDKGDPSISKTQAIAIAKKRAIQDPHGMFKKPYLKNVSRQSQTGHWVIEFSSFTPREEEESMGAMHMTITINEKTGAILSVDSSGGS